jgi:nucleoside permease NupC
LQGLADLALHLLLQNEFVAYLQLSTIGRENMTERGYLIATYALCGSVPSFLRLSYTV